MGHELKGAIYYDDRVLKHRVKCAERGCKMRVSWYQFASDPDGDFLEPRGWVFRDGLWYCQRHAEVQK